MSAPKTLAEKMNTAAEELKHCQPVLLALSQQDALILISQIQLSIKHPGNVGSGSGVAARIARSIQDALAVPKGSDLEAILNAGWEPTPAGMPTARDGDQPAPDDENLHCSRCRRIIHGEPEIGWYFFSADAPAVRFVYCRPCTAASRGDAFGSVQ